MQVNIPYEVPESSSSKKSPASSSKKSSSSPKSSHKKKVDSTTTEGTTTMTGDNGKSNGGDTKKVDKFQALLNRWKESDDGNAPLEVARPKNKSNGSLQKAENEKAIKDYKKMFIKKGFKEKKPTRGMSQLTKPAQLQNIIGEQGQGDDDSIEFYTPPIFEKTPKCIDLIRKTIESNFFFDDMDDNELPAFIEAFEPIEVHQGSNVITQGERGDYFYVIGSGTVTFQVNGDVVGTGEAGGSFGELALLYSCPRAATVVAESSPTKLYRVGQKTFRSLLQKQTKRKGAEKMKLLKSVDFLSEISEFDLKRLSQAMALNYFNVGDCLVRKGDEGDAFYIVHEGQVECRDISVGETKFDNVTLKAGDYFGERSLATNEPRTANVVATTKGSAFRIDRKTFEKVLGKFSRVIMKSQDRRILEGIDMFQFAGLQPKQFEELSNLIVDKKYRPGDVILDKLKRTNAALYLVREGSVQLSGSRNDVIKPGAYFGEDLLLLDTRQDVSSDKRAPTKTIPVFTAVASEDCLCGVLSLSDCRTIFDTTKLVETESLATTVETTPRDDDEDSDDEELVEIEAMNAASNYTLNRETTKQWLKRSSKGGLRNAVKAKIKLDDLERHNVLGEGQFGEVWLVSTILPGEYGQQHFALKIQKIEDPTRGNSVNAIRREIDVLRLMDHPYIVGLIHHYEDPEQMYILMSLVHGGELFDVIHTENEDGTWSSGLPEKDAAFYAMVLADTLDYIHRKNFVYRDLKPENVLIDKDGYPILVDFGFAKYVPDKTHTLCGTPNYLSPEVIMNRGHDASSDHWALGVLIYEMVAGENPFFYDGMPQMELFQCIVREKFYPLPDEVSDECFYVVDELLEKDPNQRLGSLAGRGKDIMAKKWFGFLSLDDLRQKKYKAPFIPTNAALEEDIERTSVNLDDINGGSVDSYGLGNTGGSSHSDCKMFGTTSSVNSGSLIDDSEAEDD